MRRSLTQLLSMAAAVLFVVAITGCKTTDSRSSLAADKAAGGCGDKCKMMGADKAAGGSAKCAGKCKTPCKNPDGSVKCAPDCKKPCCAIKGAEKTSATAAKKPCCAIKGAEKTAATATKKGCGSMKGSGKTAKGHSTMAAIKVSAAVNTNCPISGRTANASVTTKYNGKTVAFCCGGCIGAWEKLANDEKMAKLASAK